MENCCSTYDMEERLTKYKLRVAEHVASTGAKGKKLKEWSRLLWEEIFQGIPVDCEPEYPNMYPVLTAKEIVRVRKCNLCDKKLTGVYLRAMYSEDDFMYLCKPCKQEMPVKTSHFQIQYYNRRNPDIVNAKRYKMPVDVTPAEHETAVSNETCEGKFSTLDKDQIGSVLDCQVCEGQLNGAFVRCITHKGWASCMHIDCLDNFSNRASIEETQFYEQGYLTRVQAWVPIEKMPFKDEKAEAVLNSRAILLVRNCHCCGEKLGTTFTRCVYTDFESVFLCQECLKILPENVREAQHYKRGINYGKLTGVETFADGEDMPDLVDSNSDSSSEEEQPSLSRQQEWAQICEAMAIAKKWTSEKKTVDQAIKEVKRDLNRKKDDLRKKKLACVNLTLANKEPVKLAPVSQQQLTNIDPNDQATDKGANLVQNNCQVCSIPIDADYMRIRLCKGGDLFCHEKCWPSLQSKKNDFQRIYRYSAQGKLLEKVAISKPESVKKAKPAIYVPEPIAIQPVMVELKPVEYKPSWRQVDVSDYQELKKEKVKVKNNEKKHQKRAQKASKYLDLSERADLQPNLKKKWKVESKQKTPSIKEITKQQDGTVVWNSIFEQPMQLTLPLAEKPSPIEKVVMQATQPVLSAQAKEFVPSCYTSSFLPMCNFCCTAPATVINIPCRHVTSCINCFPYTAYCAVCNSPCLR